MCSVHSTDGVEQRDSVAASEIHQSSSFQSGLSYRLALCDVTKGADTGVMTGGCKWIRFRIHMIFFFSLRGCSREVKGQRYYLKVTPTQDMGIKQKKIQIIQTEAIYICTGEDSQLKHRENISVTTMCCY